MTRTILLHRTLLKIGIPLGLLAILILLMKSSFLSGNDTLNLAITVDLLLTVPLVYFFLIRTSKIPNTTVVPVMIIGLLIGSYFLPKESQHYLELFKYWALPIIELSVLTIVIVKVRRAIKTYNNLKGTTPDFYDSLKKVCHEILPSKLVIPFATEVAVFYYGFIDWKKRPINPHEYTYHKKSGTPAVFGAFLFIIVIETLALHFLLLKWSPVAAWILTGLSTYTAIQIIGFAKSLSKRPISLETNTLTLRYGILNETQISYSDIDSVVLSKKELEKDKLIQTLSPLGALESHNVLITLKRENTLTGFYGMKKPYKVIGLHLDEPNDFKERLEIALQQLT